MNAAGGSRGQAARLVFLLFVERSDDALQGLVVESRRSLGPVGKPLLIGHHCRSPAFRAYGLGSNSAHAAFGGYKQSGIGRETHKMMLEHYQQTKNLLVSYSPKKLGFF
ncbi:aldehyde dehydrogenase family protein [Streptomyces sp. ID05-39B]|uniref:aldehyde dehydrogenase family protein n=1 Tax=Streptomyces sp. ID05-39B TaxID=3028664 RepID=UPI0029A3F7AD|nr:aldehyde dehydrogenase family protein [Streptomyces sp. ID05-39B]MDX3525038.1 aldehyde dehydrogenase family protein [Streptomyces sp. ID05-39B]